MNVRMSNLAYIVSDLNTKIKVLEDEKAISLVTTVRLINDEQYCKTLEKTQPENDHKSVPPPITAKEAVHNETTKNTNPINVIQKSTLLN